jgi:hypothetical protein
MFTVHKSSSGRPGRTSGQGAQHDVGVQKHLSKLACHLPFFIIIYRANSCGRHRRFDYLAYVFFFQSYLIKNNDSKLLTVNCMLLKTRKNLAYKNGNAHSDKNY